VLFWTWAFAGVTLFNRFEIGSIILFLLKNDLFILEIHFILPYGFQLILV
jgi:hypothetical protein